MPVCAVAMLWRRLAALPASFLAIPFGFGGLALAWRAAQPTLATPELVPNILFLTSALLWLVVTLGTATQLVRQPRSVAAQFRNPALSPYLSLFGIIPLVLAAGLFPYWPAAAKVVALIAVALTVAFAGWLFGEWIAETIALEQLHPGFFIPTVTGGALGGSVLGSFGYHSIGWMCFGISVVSWVFLESVLLYRLFRGPMLAAPLVPLLAFELAPAALVGNAWFVLHPGPADPVAYLIAGWAVLMVFAQLRLIGVYRKTPFGPGFWAFAFSYSAVASYALDWIRQAAPPGARALAWLTIAAISCLVLILLEKSIRAAFRGSFLPPAPAVP